VKSPISPSQSPKRDYLKIRKSRRESATERTRISVEVKDNRATDNRSNKNTRRATLQPRVSDDSESDAEYIKVKVNGKEARGRELRISSMNAETGLEQDTTLNSASKFRSTFGRPVDSRPELETILYGDSEV
jgi:hypothetical protein